MQFDALYFLFFFAVIFGLSRVRYIGPIVYILASLLFYMVAGWKDVALILSMIAINYGLSFVIRRRFMLAAAIGVNIGTLLFFKYSAFLSGNFLPQEIFSTDIIIPLGISFYTFQMIAYQVDLVRGYSDHIRSFPKFFLFIGFFPQLVAGPIVRANEFKPQLDRVFKGKPKKHIIYSLGLGLCLLGLIKKVVLSDSIAPYVDSAFSSIPNGMAEAWQGVMLFGFQIYYDFSGYTDIALGLAYLLGIKLPLNFRQPYLSQSPQEFWRRWHITLSTWIRDYLYIPFGGSRKGGPFRQCFVLLLVMTIMGLWHGANYTFALWGLGWGLAIVLWRYAGASLKKIPYLSWFLTMIVAFTLWVFFRAPDVHFAFNYIETMFSFQGYQASLWIWVGMLILMSLHYLEGRVYNADGIKWLKKMNTPLYHGLLFGLCVCILILPKALDNPFIYFRF